jgi:putative ABC transport system permease protein
MQILREDLASAFRQIRRRKGIAAAVVLMIGIGIGANTAIFGLFKATFNQPPFPETERLVRIRTSPPQGQGESSPWVAIPEYLALEEQNQVFEAISALDYSVLTLGPAENRLPAERLDSQRIKATMLPVLGVQPQLGRGFAPGEDRVGGLVPLALISDRLWRARFGGNRDVVNSSVLVDNVDTTIIGVMPPGFTLFNDADIWIPQTFNAAQLQGSTRFTMVVARLKPGVSLDQAQTDVDAIARDLGKKSPATNAGWRFLVEPLDAVYYGETRQALLILQVAVALILLIACANVAGLLLVQGAARQHEVGTRWALGADRFRLLRQFLTESLVLALAGGVLGVVVALGGVRLLTSLSPPWLSRIHGVTIDGPFLLFAIAMSIVTGVAAGLAPGLQVSGAGGLSVLHDAGRATRGRRRQRIQGALVIGQVALTLVLLVGAGLLIKSFVRMQNADLGSDPTGVLSFDGAVSRAQYLKMTGGRINGFGEFDFSPVPAQTFERLAQRLEEIPGVASAAGISPAPFSGPSLDAPFSVVGRPRVEKDALTAGYYLVTPNYFETLRIPILRGHDFTYRDRPDTPWVVIINDAMARRYWPNENPIGQYITLDIVPDERPREIIGVVANTPPHRLERTPTPMMYLPHVQQLLRYRAPYGGFRLGMTFMLRLTTPPDAVVPAVRKAVADIDPSIPVANVQMLEQYLAEQIETPRFYMITLALFGGFATLLAVFGIYGVIAYSVAQRAREIAIRVAVGARPRSVIGLVLRQAVVLASIGVAIGIVVSIFVTRYLSVVQGGVTPVLWGVTPTDPPTFIDVALLFTVVAIAAGLVPTYRALRLEPRSVLVET